MKESSLHDPRQGPFSDSVAAFWPLLTCTRWILRLDALALPVYSVRTQDPRPPSRSCAPAPRPTLQGKSRHSLDEHIRSLCRLMHQTIAPWILSPTPTLHQPLRRHMARRTLTPRFRRCSKNIALGLSVAFLQRHDVPLKPQPRRMLSSHDPMCAHAKADTRTALMRRNRTHIGADRGTIR